MALELALFLLALFLPGYFFVNLVFPRRQSLGGKHDLLYRVFLGVVLSVAFLILYGTALVLLGGGIEQVLFRPDLLWPGLVALALVLFVVGFLRGAYPTLHGWLGRPVLEPREPQRPSREAFNRLMALTDQVEEVRRELASNPERRAELQPVLDELGAEKARLEREAGRTW